MATKPMTRSLTTKKLARAKKKILLLPLPQVTGVRIRTCSPHTLEGETQEVLTPSEFFARINALSFTLTVESEEISYSLTVRQSKGKGSDSDDEVFMLYANKSAFLLSFFQVLEAKIRSSLRS